MGIERPSQRSPGATTAPTTSGGSGERGGEARDDTSPVAPSGQSAAAIEAAGSDGSGGLLTAGIAAGVLGAGLLAGFGLRRLLRDA